jgi:single-stranded-DNA-specific exonuclease
MRKWIFPNPAAGEPAPLTAPPAAPDLDPLAAAVLARRGVDAPAAVDAFLNPAGQPSVSPYELPGMRAAVERLLRAVDGGETIGVWGDFDADGQTATALLVEALRKLGARVIFHIPVRSRESHGVSPEYLAEMIAEGARLVLTCDTGVSAAAAAQAARAAGVDLLITDHHQLPDSLPDAFTIVNPQFLPPAHPLAPLCGVGVAYKLAEALFAERGLATESAAALDLVALGTIADLAGLTGENRRLVQLGLARLRETRRLGLQAMVENAGAAAETLTEEQVSFLLAPRINALGRLSDANAAVEFFTTDVLSRARILSLEMESLNAQRKMLCEQVYQAAAAALERDPGLRADAVLVLSHPGWPAGVIGIVASRLVERTGRPTLLIAEPPDEAARGSARSVPGVDITRLIAANSRLLLGYGGHPMAAGFSLAAENIPAFRRAVNQSARALDLDPAERAALTIDAAAGLGEWTLAKAAGLRRLAPFGPGNPAPIFAARNLTLTGWRGMGKNEEHLRLALADPAGREFEVIWWQGDAHLLPDQRESGQIDLAYTVQASDYRGSPKILFQYVDHRGARADGDDGAETGAGPGLEILDLRAAPKTWEALQPHLPDGCAVWLEGAAVPGVPGRSRLQLGPAPALALWTSPPSPAVLLDLVLRAKPGVVVLIGADPGLDQPAAFLKRLAGLLKYVLHNQAGECSLAQLCAAAAHDLPAVRAGLAALHAAGLFALAETGAETISVRAGAHTTADLVKWISPALAHALGEAAAYRAYFAAASAGALLTGLREMLLPPKKK